MFKNYVPIHEMISIKTYHKTCSISVHKASNYAKNVFTKYLKCLNSASNYQHGMGLYIIRNVIKYTPLISKYIGGVYLDRINRYMYLRDLLMYSK